MRGIKGFVIFFLLILAFKIIIIPIISADSNQNNNFKNIIIIDKFNGDYQNVQDAINNAIEGSTIIVKSGTYNEIINVNKKLTIIGENKYTTFINPISDKNKYGMKLSVSNITIKNLSISNSGSGIYSTGLRVSADKSKIINCIFYDNPIGIAIFSNDNIIINCSFSNCVDEGIALIGTKISNCNFNTISNCTFYNNCDGIELQYSSDNIIENCTIFNNSHTGIDAILSSNDNNKIKNCKIYNNKVNGIYFSNSYNNIIKNCILMNNENGDIIERNLSSNNTYFNNTHNLSSIDNINHNDSKKVLFLDLNDSNNNRFSLDLLNRLIEMISNINPLIRTYFDHYF